MTPATMSTFFALLSLACWAGTGGTLVLVALRRWRPGSGAAAMADAVGASALGLACLVATVTMAGSLYYSLVAHYVPCELCWYQRICLYPLGAVLAVAAFRRDTRVWVYVLPPAVVGAVIAAYHTQLQAYPTQRSFCSSFNPCTARWVWKFGFVSLPFMALAAFCFVITMVLVARNSRPPADDEDLDQPASTTPEVSRSREVQPTR